MTGYWSLAYPKMKHRSNHKKLMVACMVLTISDLSSEKIAYEKLEYDNRHCTIWKKGVMHVKNSCWLPSPTIEILTSHSHFMAIWRIGIDVVGAITPPSSKSHRYILAITLYFSKWLEAISLKEVKASNVVKFIKNHVIYRFGIPKWIVHDNEPYFVGQSFYKLCNKFKIRSIASTAYSLAANGQVETFNNTMIKVLKKLVKKNKRGWNEKLGECLSAYRTTMRTPTNAISFSLVYGCMAIFPLEIQISSLCILLALVITENNHKLRLQELEILDEKSFKASNA